MLFEFNQYSSLLLPAFVQGLLFTVLLLWRGFWQERFSDKLLAVLLLIYTLQVTNWMLGFANWYDIHDWHTTFLFYMPFKHWLAVGPLIYFYFRCLTNHDFRFQRKDWWHFLPEGLWLLRNFGVFFVDIVLNHWVSGEPLPEFFNTQGKLSDTGLGLLDHLWQYLEYTSVFAYLVITLKLFQKYQRYILDNFSDTEKIKFSWLRNFLIANILGQFLWLGFDIVGLLADEPLSYIQDWYSFFFLGILIYYLSIAGYYSGMAERQQAALYFEPKIEEPILEKSQENEEIKTQQASLITFMETEKPYLNADLSLADLAAQFNTTAGQLSKIINASFGKNFNDFINEYRVEAVKLKLTTPGSEHLSLLGVAFECGFNSKATFNRAFKKKTGISPSEFVATVKV